MSCVSNDYSCQVVMGIRYLSIDIGTNVFENGQGVRRPVKNYLPICLHIKHFHPSSIKCSKIVKKFYKKMKKKRTILGTTLPPQDSSSTKIVYQNCLTGQLKTKLPKHGTLVDSDMVGNSMPPVFSRLLMNSFQPCTQCDNVYSNNDYVQWFKEHVCTQCIINNPEEYRQMSRNDLYDMYQGRFTKTYINRIVKDIRCRPNIANNRYRTKAKVYINKHFKQRVFGEPAPKRVRR